MAEELTTLGGWPAAGEKGPGRLAGAAALAGGAGPGLAPRRRAAAIPPCVSVELLLRAEHRPGGALLRRHRARLPRRLERDRAAALPNCWPRRSRCWRFWGCRSSSGPAGQRGALSLGRPGQCRRRRTAGPQGGVLQPDFLCPPLAWLFLCVAVVGAVLSRALGSTGPLGRSGGDVAMERIAGPALLLLAATMTFASFDWLMSLSPEWFSTIFGVYFFSGAMVAFLAAVIVVGAGPASQRTIDRKRDRRTLPRPGKTALCVRYFLGLHRLFAVLADLVRQHSRGDRLVCWSGRQGGWATVSLLLLLFELVDPVLRTVVSRGEASQGGVGILGRLDARGALDRSVLAGYAQCLADRSPLAFVDVRLPGRPRLPLPCGRVPCGGGLRAGAAERPQAGGIAGL